MNPRRPRRPVPVLGAHMSIGGGLHEAILRAAALRCTALQIFTRNSNQWAIKPLDPEAVRRWKETLGEHPMATLAHGSYLVNLGSPDEAHYGRSQRTFLEEARRCDTLGIPYLVFHPGAHMNHGEAHGLGRITRALDWVDRELGSSPVRLLLENTAGQGTSLGHRFEHLAWIMSHVRRPQRLGVCLDTCHLLAAGHDIRTDDGYEGVFSEFDRLVGVESIRAFHLNDSKKGLGSRVDRHQHIGKGAIGSRAFRLLLGDPRFVRTPKVLETPKAGNMDRRNLALLRRLAHPAPGRTRRRV